MKFTNLRILLTALFLLTLLASVGFFIVFRSFTKFQNTTQNNPTPTQIPTATPRTTPLIVKGSIPYWDQENAIESFQDNVEKFDYINVFWYFLGSDGTIRTYKDADEDQSLITFAHARNVKVFAVLTNLPETEGTSWDSKRVEQIIKTKTSRQKHINDILQLLKKNNFDGIAIDYEEVVESQKNNFTAFIQELGEAINKENKQMSVALHPKTEISGDEGLGEFQDWQAISRYADHLHIMSYGEHWDEGKAGPIASISWIKKIIRLTQKLNIPREKVFLGIGLYGYDWNKDNEESAEGLTYEQVQDLLIENGVEEEWNEEESSPYFFYKDDEENTHEVWYENAHSVKEKIEVADNVGLGGINFWRLGEEDKEVWKLLQ